MKLDSFFGLVALAGGLVFSATAATPAWPGFRGANCSGVAVDSSPPVDISPSNSVLWKVQVPWSPSSPCIWGDQIYLTTFNDGELQTRCYHRQDGALAWTRGVKPEKVEMFHSTESSPAVPTPATDGERVVSYFGSFGLICYDGKGTELWRYPMPLARSAGGYGTASSPLIAGNLVVVLRDQNYESSLLAVDLRTGQKAWETPRPEAHGSFGSPILWRNKDVDEVITPGSLCLKGYALSTGVEDWHVQGTAAFACTTPVVGDGELFFAAWANGKADSPWPKWEDFLEKFDKGKHGFIDLEEMNPVMRDYMRGLDLNNDGKIDKSEYDTLQAATAKGDNLLLAVNPGGHGDITQSHVAWKFTRGLPYVPSPLYYDGRIYLIKTGGMFSSVDAKTGNAYYTQERLEAPGDYYSSPVAGGGKIYVASLEGKLTVIKAGGDKPEILHQAEFGERILASPALVGDKLYLRTQTTLYAFGAEAGR
jgi:outer membrane protein assembly factor BamB